MDYQKAQASFCVNYSGVMGEFNISRIKQEPLDVPQDLFSNIPLPAPRQLFQAEKTTLIGVKVEPIIVPKVGPQSQEFSAENYRNPNPLIPLPSFSDFLSNKALPVLGQQTQAEKTTLMGVKVKPQCQNFSAGNYRDPNPLTPLPSFPDFLSKIALPAPRQQTQAEKTTLMGVKVKLQCQNFSAGNYRDPNPPSLPNSISNIALPAPRQPAQTEKTILKEMKAIPKVETQRQDFSAGNYWNSNPFTPLPSFSEFLSNNALPAPRQHTQAEKTILKGLKVEPQFQDSSAGNCSIPNPPSSAPSSAPSLPNSISNIPLPAPRQLFQAEKTTPMGVKVEPIIVSKVKPQRQDFSAENFWNSNLSTPLPSFSDFLSNNALPAPKQHTQAEKMILKELKVEPHCQDFSAGNYRNPNQPSSAPSSAPNISSNIPLPAPRQLFEAEKTTLIGVKVEPIIVPKVEPQCQDFSTGNHGNSKSPSSTPSSAPSLPNVFSNIPLLAPSKLFQAENTILKGVKVEPIIVPKVEPQCQDFSVRNNGNPKPPSSTPRLPNLFSNIPLPAPRQQTQTDKTILKEMKAIPKVEQRCQDFSAVNHVNPNPPSSAPSLPERTTSTSTGQLKKQFYSIFFNYGKESVSEFFARFDDALRKLETRLGHLLHEDKVEEVFERAVNKTIPVLTTLTMGYRIFKMGEYMPMDEIRKWLLHAEQKRCLVGDHAQKAAVHFVFKLLNLDNFFNKPGPKICCFNCGGFGHYSDECLRTDGKRKCYQCKMFTYHIAKDCPENPANSNNHSQGNVNTHNRGEKRRSNTDTDPANKMIKIETVSTVNIKIETKTKITVSS